MTRFRVVAPAGVRCTLSFAFERADAGLDLDELAVRRDRAEHVGEQASVGPRRTDRDGRVARPPHHLRDEGVRRRLYGGFEALVGHSPQRERCVAAHSTPMPSAMPATSRSATRRRLTPALSDGHERREGRG